MCLCVLCDPLQVENDVALMCSAYYAHSKIGAAKKFSYRIDPQIMRLAVISLEDELGVAICKSISSEHKAGREKVLESEEDEEKLEISVESEAESNVENINGDNKPLLASYISVISSSRKTAKPTSV